MTVADGSRETSTNEPAASDARSDAGSDADDPRVPAAAPAVPAPAPRRLAATETPVVTEQQTLSADAALSNQVSPLGTPQQIEREKIAMSTAKSLPVALMKIILRFGFLAAAKEQFALVGGPDAANREALDNAIDEYALAASFQQQILNPLDPADPGHRLVCTTQIRRLLGNRRCAEVEVGALSQTEAAQLLLETAGLLEDEAERTAELEH